MDDTWKVLIHPFANGALTIPGEGTRALFLGARPGVQLPEGFSSSLDVVQGFRPHFLALRQEEFQISPHAEGDRYDLALVLCDRHRGENELQIAEAIERTRPEGRIVVAGSKDDGIASLRKRLAESLDIDGSLSKYHGIAFWFQRQGGAETASTLRSANPDRLVENRFHTKPGMFSHERVDPGSRFLAENLPDDLSCDVADFCAGWGFLAAQIAARFEAISSLDLYEADFEAVEAAKLNLAETSKRTAFFWHDLVGEPVERRYDTIVMNPPFHTGRAAEPELGQKMIGAAAKALKPEGRLVLVANHQLPYEATLARSFSAHGEICRDVRFKVLWGRR